MGAKGLLHPSNNRDANDLDILFRLLAINPHILNLMHDIQSLHRPAENRMFLIQPRRFLRRDEKLRAVRVGPRIRHTDRVRFVVLERREFIFKLMAPDAGAAGTVTEGIASLWKQTYQPS